MKHRRIAGGLVLVALFVTLTQAQELPNAKAVYETTCATCHATGVAGAPRTGDVAAWAARFDKGISALYASAIKGTGAMPPKGGNSSLTDAQVMAAVNHIAGLSAKPGTSASTGRKAAKPLETAKGGAPVAADAVKGSAPVAADAAKGGALVAADVAKGKLVYQATCAACHTSGLAGAPKLGDVAAWAPRVKAGTQAVYANAIKGKGAMPPKGGNASLPDADLRAAVDFMLGQARMETAATKPSVSIAPAAQTPVAGPVAVAIAPAAAVPDRLSQAQDPTDPNAFNRLLPAPARRNRPPVEDGIHDPASSGTALLQPPLRSFQSLPRSNLGNFVDWVAALGSKRIQPRWDVRDPTAQATVMDLNIVREVKGSMNDVVFPHKQHTEWLDCSNCHPAIFKPQKGANQISMAAIMLGQQCGVCHGKVAFPISECRLCHARQKSVEARVTGGGKP
jgi:c(7)-type cytochrome triheme protein